MLYKSWPLWQTSRCILNTDCIPYTTYSFQCARHSKESHSRGEASYWRRFWCKADSSLWCVSGFCHYEDRPSGKDQLHKNRSTDCWFSAPWDGSTRASWCKQGWKDSCVRSLHFIKLRSLRWAWSDNSWSVRTQINSALYRITWSISFFVWCCVHKSSGSRGISWLWSNAGNLCARICCQWVSW